VPQESLSKMARLDRGSSRRDAPVTAPVWAMVSHMERVQVVESA